MISFTHIVDGWSKCCAGQAMGYGLTCCNFEVWWQKVFHPPSSREWVACSCLILQVLLCCKYFVFMCMGKKKEGGVIAKGKKERGWRDGWENIDGNQVPTQTGWGGRNGRILCRMIAGMRLSMNTGILHKTIFQPIPASTSSKELNLRFIFPLPFFFQGTSLRRWCFP